VNSKIIVEDGPKGRSRSLVAKEESALKDWANKERRSSFVHNILYIGFSLPAVAFAPFAFSTRLYSATIV